MSIPTARQPRALPAVAAWGRRHIDTQFLWVQERLQARSFTLHKESTADNVGDLFTKHLDATKSADFTARLGYAPREGTSALTLRAA